MIRELAEDMEKTKTMEDKSKPKRIFKAHSVTLIVVLLIFKGN